VQPAGNRGSFTYVPMTLIMYTACLLATRRHSDRGEKVLVSFGTHTNLLTLMTNPWCMLCG